jgi:hypothetical protein
MNLSTAVDACWRNGLSKHPKFWRIRACNDGVQQEAVTAMKLRRPDLLWIRDL